MKKILKIGFGLVLMIALIICGYFALSLPASLPLSPRADDAFRLTIANINYTNSDADTLAKALLKTGSDLMIVFEWTGRNLNLSELNQYGFAVLLNEPRQGTHGVCVIAKKTGVRDVRLLNSPIQGPCRIPLVGLRVQQQGEIVTILGVHAPPPVPACKETTEPTIQEMAAWIQQGKLIKALGKSRVGESVIVAGDLNVGPFNSVLRDLRKSGLQDAFAAGAWRPRPTWSPQSWVPACLRIDYIWIPTEFTIANARVVHLPGSDHRGVVVDVIL
jgi:endonuclease/exonuclease/phosphatase family metal-dependent hydrolase